MPLFFPFVKGNCNGQQPLGFCAEPNPHNKKAKMILENVKAEQVFIVEMRIIINDFFFFKRRTHVTLT